MVEVIGSVPIQPCRGPFYILAVRNVPDVTRALTKTPMWIRGNVTPFDAIP